jgi:hypothetical protein
MDDGPEPVVSYGIGLIGKDTVVLLKCYALGDEFAQWQSTFDAIGASFHFDPGYGFETETDGSGGALIGVIGAAAVIGVAVMAKLARRRRGLPSSDGPTETTEAPR